MNTTQDVQHQNDCPNTPICGLTGEQVAQRVASGQTNYVKKQLGKSPMSIIADNVLTPFNFIGLVVFLLIAVAGSWNNAPFVVVISANTLIGIIQEFRAKASVSKLSLLSAPSACVIRDGKETQIPVDRIVKDDVIELFAGKQIPSDCTVLQGEMEVNESMLTGESLPVKKQIGDTLLSGSYVVSGKCYAVVCNVGADNYIERLTSQAKQYKKPKSELMKSIGGLIKIISVAVFPLGIAAFLVAFFANGLVWREALAKACGSMIGMIPSGMALLTSMTLAVSTIKMARKKALVQDLYSVEMLARVNCLCLDKTGTITDGTMKVEKVLPFDCDEMQVGAIVAGILHLTADQNDTAKALATAFPPAPYCEAREVIPFSSERKYSGFCDNKDVKYLLGAPEFVLKDSLSQEVKKEIEGYSCDGLRTLCLARVEQGNTVLLALIVLSDNIRSDAPDIIAWFVNNNVSVKVISGDNPRTVSVIAQQVGVENADKFISLDGMTDEEIEKIAHQYTIFGRVNPQQKALLVRCFKQQNMTVAMTGDGVNDILALRQCDCAVTVASGSEAARSVANIVLTDNKFGVMPAVVAEGRQVVNNIQNSSALFLMKTIMTLVSTIFTLCILAPYPFEPMHLYVIEFCVIGVPAFFLALRKNTALIKGRFINNTLSSTVPKGIALALSVVAVYALARPLGISEQQIPTYAMLAMTFAGVAGLFVLCYPFSKANFAVSCLSLIASVVACYLLYILFASNGYLYGFDKRAIVYTVISVCVATGIMVVGKIITQKVAHRHNHN